MPYWADRASAALARELNSLRKDSAVLILLARSVLEDLVMRHINTTLYVMMSRIIPTPLIPNYMEKLEVISCGSQGPALRRTLRGWADQTILHYSRIEKRPQELEHPPVPHPFGRQAHEDIVVYPVKELLQVDIHHVAIALGNI
jgi:hypothetical protein